MGVFNIWNTSGTNKASLTFTGSSDVTVDSNNLSGLTGNVQTQLGQMIGVGQTWQDITSSRVLGTAYTNTTGKPIALIFSCSSVNTVGAYFRFYVNGLLAYGSQVPVSGYSPSSYTCVIPNNSTYKIEISAGTTTNPIWLELR